MKIIFVLKIKYPLILLCNFAVAQSDTLKAVLIEASKQYNQLTKDVIASQQLDQSIATSITDVLSKNSLIYVKDYGLGGSSTFSIRGLGSANASVVWNGLNISSLTLGLSDISIISKNLWNKISVIQSNNASIIGSGANNGAVILENNVQFNTMNRLKLSQSYGSYFNNQTDVNYVFATERWFINPRLYYNASRNNFEYSDINQNFQRRMHNKTHNHGFCTDMGMRISPKDVIKGSIWYNDSYKEIPNSILGTLDSANQRDKFFKFNFTYLRQMEASGLRIYVTASKDQLFYVNNGISINSNFKTFNKLLGMDYTISVHQYHNFNFNVLLNHQTINTNNYLLPINRLFLMPLMSHSYTKNKISITTQFRLEYSTKERVLPIVPTLNFNYQIAKSITIQTILARNFRRPTLNDLYWNPGGNLNLKIEDGVHGEMGIDIDFKKKNASLNINLFYDALKNQIIWQPYGLYWQPFNKKQTESKGVIVKYHQNYKINAASAISMIAQYQFIYSVDKQTSFTLPYIPNHSALINATYTHKKLSIWLINNYKSRRFITNDEQNSLTPYLITDWGASYQFNTALHSKSKISVNVNNLFNTQYSTIAWYHMPTRYIIGNYTIEF